MPSTFTAFIAGLMYTLLIYFILAICYLIFFFSMRKSKLIDKSQRSTFIKHVVIMHAIYFIPLVLLSMFNMLEQYVIVVGSVFVLMVATYPVSKLTFHCQNKQN